MVLTFVLVSPVMGPLWGTAAKAALVAVTPVTQGVIHLLLCKLESLLGLDAEVASLHGVHGEVAGIPQTAPLRGAYPDQAPVSGLQTQQIVHELLGLCSVLLLQKCCQITCYKSLYKPIRDYDLAGDVVHDQEGDGPLVIPGDLARVSVTAPKLSPESLSLVNVRLVSSGLSLSSLMASINREYLPWQSKPRPRQSRH